MIRRKQGDYFLLILMDRFLILDSAEDTVLDPLIDSEHSTLVFFFTAQKEESKPGMNSKYQKNYKRIRYGFMLIFII